MSGLSIHDLARKPPSSLGSKSLFDGDFVLKNNTADRNDLFWMYSLVDHSRYRMKILPVVVSMLDYFIPVPIVPFLNELRFPLDPAFVDFLNLIQSQLAHVHPNAV